MVAAVGELIRRVSDTARAEAIGFRFGEKGTHTSRTLMLAELSHLLESRSAPASGAGYAEAIIDENETVKRTASTRRSTNQRLGALYAVDPSVAFVRILRQFWASDEAAGRYWPSSAP